VAERTLNKANAMGSRSKKGRADQTEMVNASMKKSLVPVTNAANRIIHATNACMPMPIKLKKKNPNSGVQVISLSKERNQPVGSNIMYKYSVPKELRNTNNIVDITIANVAELSNPTDKV